VRAAGVIIEAPCSPLTNDWQQCRYPRRINQTPVCGRCAPLACDAKTPPAGGSTGSCCTPAGGCTVMHGAQCQPTCDPGYTVTGPSICRYARLSAAKCLPNPCEQTPCSTDAKRSAQLTNNAPPLRLDTGNISVAPANGGMGNCPQGAPWLAEAGGNLSNVDWDKWRRWNFSDGTLLPHGTTCVPSCNPGYTLHATDSTSALASRLGEPNSCPIEAPCPPFPSHGASLRQPLGAGVGHTCQAGKLIPSVCLPLPCDASAPPLHGLPGDCDAALPSGKTCQPTVRKAGRAQLLTKHAPLN
jgi:hypothetical protein